MTESRHLPWHLFQENYLDPGVPAQWPIHGSPEMFLVFQPSPGLLGIVVDQPADEPLQIDRKNIFSDLYPSDGKEISRVFVRDEPLFREFYSICTEVADRVQNGGEPFAQAITETVAAFDLLLRSAATLSAAEEIGLVGELLVLEALIDLNGASAIEAWRGPDRDKHDFRFDNLEIEVKTTTGARREHWIHGLEQLEASVECDLKLLSVQLARTAGDGGTSLQMLVKDVIDRLAKHTKEREVFKDCVANVIGLARLEQTDSMFLLRSSPKAYLVASDFPRLRAKTLKQLPGDASSHIRDVHYLLNVDDIESGAVGDPVTAIIDRIERDHG